MAGHMSSFVLLFLILQDSCHCFRSPLSVFKRVQESSSTPGSNGCSGPTRPIYSADSSDYTLDIRMPGVTPTESDTYFCKSYRLPDDDEAYVVDFKPHASMDTAHHMLLFGCGSPSSTEEYWDCEAGTCTDKSSIMYAWARNAPPTKLPKGVGFKVGGSSGIKYFVLQVHYGNAKAFQDKHKDCTGVTVQITQERQPLLAGIYLLMSVNTVIPPGEKVVYSDIACPYKKPAMYPFAYRVHTHQLGQVVSGYRIRNGKWSLIGRQSPQLPQAFYPVEHSLDVRPGDILAARCVFTGQGRMSSTFIGGTSNDEMCNLYIMYYMDAAHASSYMTCVDTGDQDLFDHIPDIANIPVPVSPDMVMGHGGHKDMTGHDKQQPKREEEQVLDQGDFYSVLSKLLGEREDVVHIHKYNPTDILNSDLVEEIADVVQKKDPGWYISRQVLAHEERPDTILVRDRIHKFHRLESTLRPPGNTLQSLFQQAKLGGMDKQHPGGVHLEEAVDWPGLKLKLGQVSGLALDPNNNLVIFHRGNHVWDENSFDRNFVYQERGIGPIEESTIVVVNPNSSAIVQTTGKNMFYLPHGITVDRDGNFWVTDVALHQVFKLGADGSRIFTLGKAFEPGSDRRSFCQPTDVAVDPITGNFFVADGYCNSRIMQFSPQGMLIMQWGEPSSSRMSRPSEFRIPHSLALIPDQLQLCVADRENGRIQCFHSETGHFVKEIKHAAFGGRVFAVSYALGGTLYAVNGKSYYGMSKPVQGFAMNFTTGEIMDTFVPVRKVIQLLYRKPCATNEFFEGLLPERWAHYNMLGKFCVTKEYIEGELPENCGNINKPGMPKKLEEFDMPHDIVASEDGSVYVGDAHADAVWKFAPSEKAEHRSVKKAGFEVEEITETEVYETRVRSRPKTNMTAPEQHNGQAKQTVVQQSSVGVSFILIITLLVIPIVALVGIAIFIRWRKNRVYGGEDHKSESTSGGILGKLRGKGTSGLNLGTFFASHKGYSRKGFDRLSTEGSDQEKDDDGSDSEEEYSAPPMPAAASSSS